TVGSARRSTPSRFCADVRTARPARGTASRVNRRHRRIEPGEPADDFFACQGRIADLAMLLRPFPRREYPRRDGTRTDELAHRPVEPLDVEQVILLAFRQQPVL